jgi:ATP-dependent DNA ligase
VFDFVNPIGTGRRFGRFNWLSWDNEPGRKTRDYRRIEAKGFTVDGEAVVLGPDGLSRFEELSRREAADTAILYAFDLIEHDGEDVRRRPFLDPRPRRRAY